jgi:hypothetical protein
MNFRAFLPSFPLSFPSVTYLFPMYKHFCVEKYKNSMNTPNLRNYHL